VLVLTLRDDYNIYSLCWHDSADVTIVTSGINEVGSGSYPYLCYVELPLYFHLQDSLYTVPINEMSREAVVAMDTGVNL
jgi:hypothetical protein